MTYKVQLGRTAHPAYTKTFGTENKARAFVKKQADDLRYRHARTIPVEVRAHSDVWQAISEIEEELAAIVFSSTHEAIEVDIDERYTIYIEVWMEQQ